MRPGLPEILIILGIALLLFGAGRLADIGKGLGQGIRNFKKGLKDEDDEEDDLLTEGEDDDEEEEVVAPKPKRSAKSKSAKRKKKRRVDDEDA